MLFNTHNFPPGEAIPSVCLCPPGPAGPKETGATAILQMLLQPWNQKPPEESKLEHLKLQRWKCKAGGNNLEVAKWIAQYQTMANRGR